MSDPVPPAASARRAALVFIFITVVLDMLALGIIVPVLPKLVVDFEGGDTARGAEVYGLFGTVWALMQFVFSPVLGALSDRFGRRPVILLSNFGLGLDYILMALAPSLAWLFVGPRDLGHHRGELRAPPAPTSPTSTPPEKRAAGFGLLGAAFGLGFVLGPAIGGLLGGIDPRLPFWFAAGLSLAQRRLRPVRAARVAAARAARAVRLAAREPDRRRSGCCARTARCCGSGGVELPLRRRARRAAEHLRALRELSLRLGRAHGRTRCSPPSACAG